MWPTCLFWLSQPRGAEATQRMDTHERAGCWPTQREQVVVFVAGPVVRREASSLVGGSSADEMFCGVHRQGERVRDSWLAADTAALGRSVTVEVCIGEKVVTTAVANEYRQDLAFLGFGTGRHGFQCTVPIGQAHNAVKAATVRIRGSDHHLAYQGKTMIPLDSSVIVEFMAGDIVNNCNLRCPFVSPTTATRDPPT